MAASISSAAYAALPCLRCDILEEEIEKLRGLVRDIHYAGPVGDLCFPQHGCTPDLRWESHADGCLTKRVVGAIGEGD